MLRQSKDLFVATLALLLGFALVTPSRAAASDATKCAAAVQKAYGIYAACNLKTQSKATGKGTTADLIRCEAKLEKVLSKAERKYGAEACQNLNTEDVTAFIDQCAEGVTDASLGSISSSDLATADTACSEETAFDSNSGRCRPLAELFAATPPGIDTITVNPSDDKTTADVQVTFSEGQKVRLPNSLSLDIGERKKVTLTATGKERLTYTGKIPYHSEEWTEYNQALAESVDAAGGHPVSRFEGRVKVSSVSPSSPFLSGPTGRAAAFSLPVSPAVFPVIDDAATLMVIDPLVVEDVTRTFDPCNPPGTPMGKWTFGRLMTEMANQPLTGIDPAVLTRDLLETWLVDQTVNGLTIPARAVDMQAVIDRWEAVSGGSTSPLDLGLAPFRLLAIVNRVDLRDNSAYGGGGNCGEGRFVFGLLNHDPVTGACNPMRFGVIFEYGVNIPNCRMCRKYARKWLALQDPTLLPIGSPAYNAELENLTDIFSLAGTNPGNPNGSSLNQLRTNENALNPTWEMREFVLDPAGFLAPDTTKQNPRMDINFTVDLENWVNPNATDICNNNYTVPDEEPAGIPFLAAATPYFSHTFLDGVSAASMPDRCARFELSLNSCVGCHAAETLTPFCHVGTNCTRPLGAPVNLSGFLTGITVDDAADGPPPAGVTRDFADLDRREVDLWNAANMPCFPRLALPILKAVH